MARGGAAVFQSLGMGNTILSGLCRCADTQKKAVWQPLTPSQSNTNDIEQDKSEYRLARSIPRHAEVF